jgi:hypothetical protein
MSVPALPKDWTGPRYVPRKVVAAALSCCEATVSRRLGAYAVQVGGLLRFDLQRILEDHALGDEVE